MTAFRVGRLDVQIASTADGARVVLVGRLDDTCQVGELAAQLPPGHVVIDTAGVTFVNSIGIREWIRLLRALRERRSQVDLEGLADVLMVHMNVLAEFRGLARITSFHATYTCMACGYEAAMPIDAVGHLDELRKLRTPTLVCPECGGAMELADFPERYLSIFL
jgi:anti-anti-sigma regulatory factor/DNA-directed RNA polymerase subunit RPC12/RpoP